MRRIICIGLCVFALAAFGCVKSEPEDIFVLHILFMFSDEQILELQGADSDRLEEAAQSLKTTKDGEERFVLGEDSVYSMLSAELSGASGADAVEIFNQFISTYNDDPGVEYYPNGYQVPLSGDSSFVQPFTDLARELYAVHGADGEGAVFIDGKLAYCVSEYGVHFMMVKSVK